MNLLLLWVALVAGPARELVTVAPQETPLTARRGAAFEVTLRFEVASGYHINSNKPTLDYLIPTRVEWSSSKLKHRGDIFPRAMLRSFSFAPEKKLAVYEGRQTLKSRFAVPADAPAGRLALQGKLRYQACDDKACYPPASVDFQVPVEVRR